MVTFKFLFIAATPRSESLPVNKHMLFLSKPNSLHTSRNDPFALTSSDSINEPSLMYFKAVENRNSCQDSLDRRCTESRN